MKNLKYLEHADGLLWFHVDFNEEEEIMKDKSNVPDAFSIIYNPQTRKAEILNEGFLIDYTLTPEEMEQIESYL